MHFRELRFALAWMLPLAVGVAAWHSLWTAWAWRWPCGTSIAAVAGQRWSFSVSASVASPAAKAIPSRTLVGSFISAWRLESGQIKQRRRTWFRSPLLCATLAQAAGSIALVTLFGAGARLFWLVQAAYAVFLLEAINYIEHYGLQRRIVNGRPEPFSGQHAWNADRALTKCFIANLQRQSDHHLHAWKP